MGSQRILQAVVVVAATFTIAHAERVAVIDLGPAGDNARKSIATAIVAGGFERAAEDGLDEALAGEGGDRDAVTFAAALESAKTAFGALDCATATTAARSAIAIGAARQAAGIAMNDLPRAWAFVLLCADRQGKTDVAMIAAKRLRSVGGSPDVPADLLAKYPEIDAIGGGDRVPVTIEGPKGSTVWIDHASVGPSPAQVVLDQGEHLIAVANGTNRGAQEIAIIPPPKGAPPLPPISIAASEQKGAWSELAIRVSGWHGKIPAPSEIAWVLTRARAKVAIIRYGDTIEAWGSAGRAEAPHRLGGEDGIGKLDDIKRMLQLIDDRVHAWTDRAPDPDQPLMLETARIMKERRSEPTQWWVYATIAGAVAGAALLVYLHDSADDVQHVEIKYP